MSDNDMTKVGKGVASTKFSATLQCFNGLHEVVSENYAYLCNRNNHIFKVIKAAIREDKRLLL